MRQLPRAVGEGSVAGRARSSTAGVRAAGRVGRWAFEAEWLGQRGHVADTPLAAWAGTAQVQRVVRSAPWQPTLLAEVNYASGDADPIDGRAGTFDQLYPTNHGIYGVADRVGRRNARNGRVGIWLRPMAAMTLKVEGHSFWLADRHDALYAAGGSVVVPAVAGGATSTHVGEEL